METFGQNELVDFISFCMSAFGCIHFVLIVHVNNVGTKKKKHLCRYIPILVTNTSFTIALCFAQKRTHIYIKYINNWTNFDDGEKSIE
jgi:hypothetical protein